MKVIVSCESASVKDRPLIRIFEPKEVILDSKRKELTVVLDRYVRYVFSYDGYCEDEIIYRIGSDLINLLDLVLLYQTGYEG